MPIQLKFVDRMESMGKSYVQAWLCRDLSVCKLRSLWNFLLFEMQGNVLEDLNHGHDMIWVILKDPLKDKSGRGELNAIKRQGTRRKSTKIMKNGLRNRDRKRRPWGGGEESRKERHYVQSNKDKTDIRLLLVTNSLEKTVGPIYKSLKDKTLSI